MIKIVDSLMGTGKTQWAVNYMNSTTKRFLYVAPFLSECDRIQRECPLKNFKQPQPMPTKQEDFKMLMRMGENVAITHELFKQLHLPYDDPYIEKWDYELIVDEVVETIRPIKDLNDADYHIASQCFSVNHELKVEWNNSDQDLYWPMRYEELRLIADVGNLISVGKSFYWKIPIDLFILFENVYVMTYNFQYSHLAYDFEIAEYVYEVCHIENGHLEPGPQDISDYKRWFRDNVEIYNGRINNVGKAENALSATRFKRMTDKEKENLIKGIRSYFNMSGASGSRCMYSRYKTPFEVETNALEYPIRGYKKAAFVPFNTTAVNNYRDRDVLCYAANVYEHPHVVKYYHEMGIHVDQRGTALNTMLQWIYRSVIRSHPVDRTEPVKLAILSSRMREILNEWLAS